MKFIHNLKKYIYFNVLSNNNNRMHYLFSKLRFLICVLFLIGQFCCDQTQDKNGLTKLVADVVNDAISKTTVSGGSLKIGHGKVGIQFRSK